MLSEYLVSIAFKDLATRLKLIGLLSQEERKLIGKWSFYTCYDDAGKVLNFIDLADDVEALVNLISAYGF